MKNALTFLLLSSLLLSSFALQRRGNNDDGNRNNNNNDNHHDDDDDRDSNGNHGNNPFGRCGRDNDEKYRIHKANVKAVYNMTVFPINEYYITSQYLPNIMNPNVWGRVYPFGYHKGPRSVAEYFYALTPNRIVFGNALSVIISGVLMSEFMNCGNRAWSEIHYQISPYGNPGLVVSNATQVGTWRFDEQGRIVEFDLFQVFYSLSLRIAFPQGFPDSYKNDAKTYICQKHTAHCQGTAWEQYPNEQACLNFMSQVAFGEPDLESWDSVLCRYRHAPLTLLRPEVHCAHVGPTGGDQCHTFTLASVYQPLFNDTDRIHGSFNRL